MSFHVPNQFRVRNGHMGTTEAHGNNGYFMVTLQDGTILRVIASDGGMPGQTAWEHVSVSRTDRCATWEEMCEIKALFWSDDVCVVQYHPPKKDYINYHPYCLHLWRPVGVDMPQPDSLLVGI